MAAVSRDEVLQRTAKSIQLPYQGGVETPLVRVNHQTIQLRTRFLGAGHVLVNTLVRNLPATGGGVLTQFSQLYVGSWPFRNETLRLPTDLKIRRSTVGPRPRSHQRLHPAWRSRCRPEESGETPILTDGNFALTAAASESSTGFVGSAVKQVVRGAQLLLQVRTRLIRQHAFHI
jgi:hypothetical protein